MSSKLISFLLCVMMLMVAVSGTVIAEEHPAHLTVVATNYPLYDMAVQLGGDHLNVLYQPDASAESVEGADIVLCVGAEKDAWTDDLDGVAVVRAMNGIELIEGEEDVLTIPVNNMIVASYLNDALNAIDEAHSEVYLENLIAYVEALSALDKSFRDAVNEETAVYCEDGSMGYFAREYGVKLAEAADGAVLLNTYAYPAEEDLTVPYIELMQRNLEALLQAK